MKINISKEKQNPKLLSYNELVQNKIYKSPVYEDQYYFLSANNELMEIDNKRMNVCTVCPGYKKIKYFEVDVKITIELEEKNNLYYLFLKSNNCPFTFGKDFQANNCKMIPISNTHSLYGLVSDSIEAIQLCVYFNEGSGHKIFPLGNVLPDTLEWHYNAK